MERTTNSFTLLQATAAIVALAIMLWSFGLPSLRFAEAANVTQVSDTLSDSAPSVVSDHTITFITPTGVANGETITIDFSDGPFVVGAVDYTDIDVMDDTNDLTLADDCTGAEEVGATTTGSVLTITFCAGDGAFLPANGTTTIEIGLNATFGVAGNAQLTNPTAGSKKIPITAGPTDSGETIVAIVPSVTVTASVDTLFTFTVSGVAGGVDVNTEITTGTTTATTIPFGVLESGTASTAAQKLAVVTNASNGFVVTVTADGQLNSTTGADIDGFRNGNFDTTPVAWEGPTPSLGDEDTYGHWGVTSDDPTVTAGLSDLYGAGLFVSASTTPVEVFRHNGPTDVTGGTGVSETLVGYNVEISALQEAATDYTATLTYVATPVF
jgi:hypothetical protein